MIVYHTVELTSSMGPTRRVLELGYRSADWRNRLCSISDFRKRRMLVYVGGTDFRLAYEIIIIIMYSVINP